MRKIIISLLVISVFLFPQRKFTFAHISDTHIGNATAAEDLRRTVADLNALPGISFAVITGDITEYGSDEQLRLAKQIFDSLMIPWYIVPGNHDMKWSESGGTSFAKIFGYERFAVDLHGVKFIGMHQGPRMRMGDGYWAAEDVAWFDTLVQSMTDKRQPVFFVTHYPADSGIANWFVMTERLRKVNTQALLNGHWHRNFSGVFDGIPAVVGRSNLRAKEAVGGYTIATVSADSMTYATRIPGIETKAPWATVTLGVREFSPLPKRVDDGTGNRSVSVRWVHRSRVSMTSPPVLWKDLLAAGFSDGTVSIRSVKSGKELFTVPAGNGVFSTPAMNDDYLVVTSADSSIYCYSLHSKKLNWKFRTGASIVATPAIHNGTVFTGASDRIFRAIDLKSGAVLWQYDSLQGFVEAKPTIANGKVFVGAWDEHLYCLDEKSGALLWKWKGDKRGTLLSPAACEPVYADGKIFIVAPDRFMTVIDAETGKEVWRTNRFQVRETIGMSEDGERIYIRTMNDSLYALSSKSAQPEVIWSLHAGFGYDINPAQIREKEGIVFYATKNGLLLAINGKSGSIIHTFKEDVVIAHTPIPLAKDRVIFSNINGTIISLSWKEK